MNFEQFRKVRETARAMDEIPDASEGLGEMIDAVLSDELEIGLLMLALPIYGSIRDTVVEDGTRWEIWNEGPSPPVLWATSDSLLEALRALGVEHG